MNKKFEATGFYPADILLIQRNLFYGQKDQKSQNIILTMN